MKDSMPKPFETYCKIAGMTNEEALQRWQEINLTATQQLLTSLLERSDLSEMQLQYLESWLDQIISGTLPEFWLEDLSERLFTEQSDKDTLVADYKSDLFNCLGEFYTTLRDKMTFEQKQVVSALQNHA